MNWNFVYYNHITRCTHRFDCNALYLRSPVTLFWKSLQDLSVILWLPWQALIKLFWTIQCIIIDTLRGPMFDFQTSYICWMAGAFHSDQICCSRCGPRHLSWSGKKGTSLTPWKKLDLLECCCYRRWEKKNKCLNLWKKILRVLVHYFVFVRRQSRHQSVTLMVTYWKRRKSAWKICCF